MKDRQRVHVKDESCCYDERIRAQRALALSYSCRDCDAKPGRPCRAEGSGHPRGLYAGRFSDGSGWCPHGAFHGSRWRQRMLPPSLIHAARRTMTPAQVRDAYIR